MNWNEGTGGDVQIQRQGTSEVPLTYGSVSGDRWTPGIETPGSRSTGEDKRRSAAVSSVNRPLSLRRIPEKTMRKRRLCLKACLDEFERIWEASEDPVLRANSFDDVRRHLQVLWELVDGDPDSEALEEVVNVLQVALCVESPEALTQSQLDAIWSVIVKMHEDPDVGDQVASDLTQELIKGGVDVFREIE